MEAARKTKIVLALPINRLNENVRALLAAVVSIYAIVWWVNIVLIVCCTRELGWLSCVLFINSGSKKGIDHFKHTDVYGAAGVYSEVFVFWDNIREV